MLASLKSAYDAKRDMLKELQQEMLDIGVQADASAEERARIRRDELHNALSHNRSRRNQLEKQLTFCEAEMDGLQKKLRRLERDYHISREQVVSAKAGWCAVMRMVKITALSGVCIGASWPTLAATSCARCRIRRWARCVWR